MATIRNFQRSTRSGLRRGARFLQALLTVALLVLGPLAIVAYACSGGGEQASSVATMGGGHSHTTALSGGDPAAAGDVDPNPSTPQPPAPPTSTNDPDIPDTSTPPVEGPDTETPGTPRDPTADDTVDDPAATPTTEQPPGAVEPAPAAPVEPAAPGGTVTSKGSDGQKHSSRGTIEAPASDSSNAGSRAVNTIQASAAPVGVAVKPILNSIIASEERQSQESADGGASGGPEAKREEVQRRTTIARAVDGIPLVFRTALLAFIFATSILAVVSFRERRRATAASRIAQLDHLTGLANRDGFDRQMSIEWQRALRHGRPLGLVFVDLDHFKAFNDTHGHVAGDRLLREVAAAITATARASDFTARLGGDEFVVLCPDADDDGLERLVERLRVEASGMAVTLSIGAASKHEGDASPDDLVHRADVAMYQSKGGHRRGTSSANPMLGSMRRG